MLGHDLPVTRRRRIDRGGFEDGCRGSEGEWTVDDVRVTSDPTDVGHAGEAIFGVDVEDVLAGEGGAKEVTTSGMDDACKVNDW